jgi:hypothetical protein
MNLQRHPQFTQILHQVVGKRVVVVDDQHHERREKVLEQARKESPKSARSRNQWARRAETARPTFHPKQSPGMSRGFMESFRDA